MRSIVAAHILLSLREQQERESAERLRAYMERSPLLDN